jgi:hypothetical protein
LLPKKEKYLNMPAPPPRPRRRRASASAARSAMTPAMLACAVDLPRGGMLGGRETVSGLLPAAVPEGHSWSGSRSRSGRFETTMHQVATEWHATTRYMDMYILFMFNHVGSHAFWRSSFFPRRADRDARKPGPSSFSWWPRSIHEDQTAAGGLLTILAPQRSGLSLRSSTFRVLCDGGEAHDHG